MTQDMVPYRKGRKFGNWVPEILRKDWKFEGFTLSDFIYGIRHTKAAINAGMDVEMPVEIFSGRKLQKAIDEGKLSRETIDDIEVKGGKAKLTKIAKHLLAHPSSISGFCQLLNVLRNLILQFR